MARLKYFSTAALSSSITRVRRASPTSICLPVTVTCIALTASFRPLGAALGFSGWGTGRHRIIVQALSIGRQTGDFLSAPLH